VQTACKAEHLTPPDYRFSRKQLRDAIGWGDTQLKIHLARLVELEYLVAHNSGKGKTYHYELCYAGEGKDGDRFLMHLIRIENLRYDAKWSGQNEQRSGSGRPLVGGPSVGGRSDKNTENPANTDSNEDVGQINGKRTSGAEKRPSSYRTHESPALAAQAR